MVERELAHKHIVNLGISVKGREVNHVFEEKDIDAIHVALGAERPLLLRGDPGVGKSQFARAAACYLKRAYTEIVVDNRTEARDLLWQEDNVRRLSDAQMMATFNDPSEAKKKRQEIEKLSNYIFPGPLWWGFDWYDADKLPGSQAPSHAKACDPKNGVVVLIDEIDKAENDVPNGLLGALGAREFTSRIGKVSVSGNGRKWPLVIVTTNEERKLPDAFLRRCIVHDLSLPKDEKEFVELLVRRGKENFDDDDQGALEKLLTMAAEQTLKDRKTCADQKLKPLPGQAEFFDLVRVLLEDVRDDISDAQKRLEYLSQFILRKHLELK